MKSSFRTGEGGRVWHHCPDQCCQSRGRIGSHWGAAQLKAQYHQILENGAHRTCYSKLYEAYPSYINRIRDTYITSMERSSRMTKIYGQLKHYLLRISRRDETGSGFTRGCHAAAGEALSRSTRPWKRRFPPMWLKSGGYLVIEPTEAMTVIGNEYRQIHRKRKISGIPF